jgi:hypothetical protein
MQCSATSSGVENCPSYISSSMQFNMITTRARMKEPQAKPPLSITDRYTFFSSAPNKRSSKPTDDILHLRFGSQCAIRTRLGVPARFETPSRSHLDQGGLIDCLLEVLEGASLRYT